MLGEQLTRTPENFVHILLVRFDASALYHVILNMMELTGRASDIWSQNQCSVSKKRYQLLCGNDQGKIQFRTCCYFHSPFFARSQSSSKVFAAHSKSWTVK